jgi:hypothetical protein
MRSSVWRFHLHSGQCNKQHMHAPDTQCVLTVHGCFVELAPLLLYAVPAADPAAYMFQPENTLKLRAWDYGSADTTLLDLIPFLQMVQEVHVDVSGCALVGLAWEMAGQSVVCSRCLGAACMQRE